MGNAGELARDLTDRAPGHGLIEKLLTEWDAGRIRLDERGAVVIDEESKSWYWGVLGERRVAEVLAYAPGAAAVLHSVPIGSGGADIDHVVVTSAGVFTLNTKYSPGSTIWTAGYGLLVNSISRAVYLRNAAREARRAEERLSRAAGFAVPVHPVIVFVSPGHLTRKAPNEIDGVLVRVSTDTELLHMLDIRRELSDEQIARIAEVAKLPRTWLSTAKPASPGDSLAREFDALREAVGPGLDVTRPAAPRPHYPSPSRQPSPVSSIGSRVATGFAIGCGSLIALPVIAWFAITALASVLTSR